MKMRLPVTFAVLTMSAVLFSAPATAQKPGFKKAKNKAMMMDDELDRATGGTIKKAQKKAEKDFKKLKKNRTYEAIKKKRAEEARKREAARKKREAEEAKRRAEAAARRAEKKQVKADIAEVKASDLSPKDKKAKIAGIRADAKERRKARKTRQQTQRKAAKERLRAVFGKKRATKRYLKELRRHSRRTARLRRIQELAAEAGEADIVARAEQAMKREEARFDRRMAKIKAGVSQ